MKRFWKSAGAALGYFAAFLGIQLWITAAAALFILSDLFRQQGISLTRFPELMLRLYTEGLTENLTVIILASNVATVLALWLFFLLRGKKFSVEIGLLRTGAVNLLLAVVYGVGVCFSVDLLTALLPIPEDMMSGFESQHDLLWEGNVWITFLSVSLAGPVSEEICFRGLCYTRLKKAMGPILAGLIASVFFGLAHGNPVWFLVGFLAGGAMTWIFEVTGSLWCSILVHVTNNTIATVTTFWPISEDLHRSFLWIGALLLVVSAFLLWVQNRQVRRPE